MLEFEEDYEGAELPAMCDISILSALRALRNGNAGPVAKYLDRGKIAYIAKFMTLEDQVRLARHIRTGSPLTQAQKRKTRRNERERDKRILARICYWKAHGLPLYSHTTKVTAIHTAAKEYESAPLTGAPARTPESVRKHVWGTLSKTQRPLSHDILKDILAEFIKGLVDAKSSIDENTERFIWFTEKFLEGHPLVFKSHELETLLDANNSVCQKYISKMPEIRSRRTYVKFQPTSGRK